jgi:hypothetical protein
MHCQRIAPQQSEAYSIAHFSLVSSLDDTEGNPVISGFRDALVQYSAHPLHHLVRVFIEEPNDDTTGNRKKG